MINLTSVIHKEVMKTVHEDFSLESAIEDIKKTYGKDVTYCIVYSDETHDLYNAMINAYSTRDGNMAGYISFKVRRYVEPSLDTYIKHLCKLTDLSVTRGSNTITFYWQGIEYWKVSRIELEEYMKSGVYPAEIQKQFKF